MHFSWGAYKRTLFNVLLIMQVSHQKTSQLWTYGVRTIEQWTITFLEISKQLYSIAILIQSCQLLYFNMKLAHTLAHTCACRPTPTRALWKWLHCHSVAVYPSCNSTPAMLGVALFGQQLVTLVSLTIIEKWLSYTQVGLYYDFSGLVTQINNHSHQLLPFSALPLLIAWK